MKTCPVCHTSYDATAQFCSIDDTPLSFAESGKKISPGQVIAERYTIEHEVHSKGMWNVYQGRELGTEQQLIIKTAALDTHPRQEDIDAFLQRLQKLQCKYHPGLVTIIASGVLDKQYVYVIMELIEDKPLSRLLNNVRSLTVELSVCIAEQILAVLDFLHQHGITVTTLHPNKIFLLGSSVSQFVKIDVVGEFLAQTAAGNFYFEEKSNYTAPEIFCGQQWNMRCEVYTVGVMLYEMITGVLPYPQGIMLRQQGEHIPVAPPVHRLKPGIKLSRHLENTICRAIAWLPTCRFADSRQFLYALQRRGQNYVAYAAAILLLTMTILLVWELPRDFLREHGRYLIKKIRMWAAADESSKVPKPRLPVHAKKPADITESFQRAMEIIKKRPPGVSRVNISHMCYVSAGKTAIGEINGDLDEQPMQFIEIAAFYMDCTEVTCAQYEIFVKESGHRAPESWIHKHCPPGKENYPVAEVNWYDASLYAAWCGKKLPTEAEWEKAAHGDDAKGPPPQARSRRWPWGNSFVTGYANVATGQCQPVAQCPQGQSPFGIFDMAGNVWEWTNSWYDVENKQDRVIRGGSFTSSADQARTSYRDGFWPHANRKDIGFRCIKEAE
jgi:formylglycine-generating enzyme required for sulfatase activity